MCSLLKTHLLPLAHRPGCDAHALALHAWSMPVPFVGAAARWHHTHLGCQGRGSVARPAADGLVRWAALLAYACCGALLLAPCCAAATLPPRHVIAVMLITHSTPTAIMVHAMATMYNNHPDDMAALLFWEYLFAVLTLPLFIAAYLAIAGA